MNPIVNRRRCGDIGMGYDHVITQKLSSQDSFKKNELAIHFIWMGSNIPPQYLSHIKECAAKALSDKDRGYTFTVNLWVDSVNNYWNTAIKEDNIIHAKRFKIRHLSELNKSIKENYSGSTKIAQKIVSYTRRELSGFNNFAAASDILRYLILQERDGFYFDTDLSFSVAVDNDGHFCDPARSAVNRKSYWKKEKLWSKMDLQGDPIERCASTLFNVDFPFNGLSMAAESSSEGYNNCIILARNANAPLKSVIEKVIRNYIEMDSKCHAGNLFKLKPAKANFDVNDRVKKIKIKNYSEKTKVLKVTSKKFKKSFEWPITDMDIKRSSNLSIGARECEDRKKLTIDASLAPLQEKVHALNKEGSFMVKEKLILTSNEGYCHSQPIVVNCDGTWLKKEKNRSVDDNDKRIDPFKPQTFEIDPVLKFIYA
ncbi:MAG TPA: TcdA/TcdB catalytic glycosyltransferase domain-containing protein [Parachlamydiaceae bacterium]|nr:TcdA/TcdB catalytic glycosyltransferase domain-containing protein [Parachlamydiaceae bacterium]